MQRVLCRASIDVTTIREAMERSISTREVIRLKMYDAYEELIIEGVLDYYDAESGTFGVDGERFEVGNIVTVA